MKWKVSCPLPTRLFPLLVSFPMPFSNRPNSLATDVLHTLRIFGSGWRSSSLISIILPVDLSNTAIVKCDDRGTVSYLLGFFLWAFGLFLLAIFLSFNILSDFLVTLRGFESRAVLVKFVWFYWLSSLLFFVLGLLQYRLLCND